MLREHKILIVIGLGLAAVSYYFFQQQPASGAAGDGTLQGTATTTGNPFLDYNFGG